MAYAELGPNKLGETLGTYAIGYMDAARVLFEHADAGRGLVDLYFYPAAMNLRHGLELFAKQCCDYMAYELLDSSLLYVPGHSLEAPWKRIEGLLKEMLSLDGGSIDTSRLRDCAMFLGNLTVDLHALDPDGTLFRYPEFVSTKTVQKTRLRGAERRDTHVPFTRVSLTHFAELSAAAVDAAQSLEHWLGERSDFLRMQRDDPPLRLAHLVSGNVTDEQRRLWAKIRKDG